MRADQPLPTRKEFLLAMGGAALLTQQLPAQQLPAQQLPAQQLPAPTRKVLMVVAHPDDEYAFAATTYRLVRELGWAADQVIVTNGEAGYRYSALAEAVYGVALSQESDGRSHLPAIRKEEAVRAGKILGIRRHYFLDQKDSGFATDAASADSSNWDRAGILSAISRLLVRERYDAVFTLLPTAETHGHHRAATLLALEAVARLPQDGRPLFFGVEPRSKSDGPLRFGGLASQPLTATVSADPVFVFDRMTAFGYRSALNYQIVVNWVIAEHKSQGLFQKDSGVHELEQFWLFRVSGDGAAKRAEEFSASLCAVKQDSARR
jgi:N-acetylglucosamine malate deacetylase 2